MSSVGAVASTSSKLNGFSSLGSEEFLGIILTELSNQDPLQPSETKDLLEQLSTIRSIQSDEDLMGQLGALVDGNEWVSAGGLIGRHVSGLNDANLRVEGRVEAVSRTSQGPVLTLEGGRILRLSQTDQVLETPPEPDPDPESTTSNAPLTNAA